MLRSYQQESLQTSKDKWKQGVTRQLISLPTGTGKTVVFANLPVFHNVAGRILVLVHREELADQAATKIRKWNPTFSVGIEMGLEVSSPKDKVVVASVQTLSRRNNTRIEKFDPMDFDVIVCDEAHHSVSPSYKYVFDHFGLFLPDNDKLLLGVTATPNRGDGQALGQVYDEIIYDMPMLKAIQDGWLADLKGYRINTNVDLSKVHTLGGDFNIGELEEAVNTPFRNELIVRNWLKQAPERQTIAFTVDIQHAKDLADMYGQFGVVAQPIWGTDPHRKEKLAAHKDGKIQVLTNCGVLTEGYDDWRISCVVMARPTKSQLLYVQMAGRGTRIPDGINNLNEAIALGIPVEKTDCLLLDAVDNSGRHSLVTLGSIFGLPPNMDLKGKSVVATKQIVDEAVKTCPNLPLEKIMDVKNIPELLEQVNLFDVKIPAIVTENSQLTWNQMMDGSFILLLPKNNESCRIEQNLLGKWHVTINVNGFKAENTFDELHPAFRWADDMVARFGKEYLHLLKQKAKWTNDPATPSQMTLLRKFYGNRVPTDLTKGDARKLINDFIARKRTKI